MKDIKIKDWFLFGEWYDVFWFHAAYVDGQAFTISKYLGYGPSQIVVEQNKNVQSILFSRSEWTNIGKHWLQEVVQDHNKLSKVNSDLRLASDELNNLSVKLRNLEIDNLNSNDIIHWLKEYEKRHLDVWAIGQVTNVLELENSFLTDYLKNILNKKGLDSDELMRVFQILVTPRELSAAQKEERDMLKLVKQKKENGIMEHKEQYSWITFGWLGPSLSLEYFKGVYNGLVKEGQAEDKLLAIEERDNQFLADKIAWIEKLNLSDDEIDLFRQMEELLFMKTYRMDALFCSYEAIQPILKRIAKENFLSLSQIYNLPLPLLIENLENNDFNSYFINELGDYSVRYFDGEKIYLLTGEEAQKIAAPAKQVLPKREAKSEIKGECAYPGRVTGRVVIINRAEEIKKFNDGDILVSIVTDPSLLPIMKKASAFVTNQGGLTCHAAIVARELQVPCVIGTKVGTYVLNDGDVVEVDATNGVVAVILAKAGIQKQK